MSEESDLARRLAEAAERSKVSWEQAYLHGLITEHGHSGAAVVQQVVLRCLGAVMGRHHEDSQAVHGLLRPGVIEELCDLDDEVWHEVFFFYGRGRLNMSWLMRGGGDFDFWGDYRWWLSLFAIDCPPAAIDTFSGSLG